MHLFLYPAAGIRCPLLFNTFRNIISMRLLFFLLITFLSVSGLPAQSVTEINSRILELYRQKKYEEAVPLARQARELAKTEYGDTSQLYITTVESLALLYNYTSRPALSIPLYKEAARLISRTKGENNDRYLSIQISLGMAWSDLENYNEAEPFFTRAKEISLNLYGKESPDYISSIIDLAVLYSKMDQYGKSEATFLEAQTLGKKVLGESSIEYSNILNGMGILYYSLGQYDKAEKLYLQTMAIRKKEEGENNPSYAAVQNNLAVLYAKKGDYANAEKLYRKAAEIEKGKGNVPDSYTNTLCNLAILCARTGRYEEAAALYEEVKGIRKQVYGENHPRFAATLNEMGALYLRMGAYDKADSLLSLSLEKRKLLLGEQHLDYSNTLRNLASLYVQTGRYDKAEESLLQSTAIETRYLENIFSILSEKEKENYLAINLSLVEIDNSILYLQKNRSPALVKNNLELQLMLKALALTQSRGMRERVAASPDSSLRQRFRQWEIIKKNLAVQYSVPLLSRKLKTDSLEALAEKIEKELVRSVTGFDASIKLPIEKLKEQLDNDEAAIEFVSFNFYNKKWTDSILYAAYIIRKDAGDPVFIPLCEEKQLGKYFSLAGNAEVAKKIYRSDAEDEKEQPSVSGDSLYALLWKPLMPYLSGVQKISYSPSGLLYKVAFHALPAGENSLLMDHFELNQYVSLRQRVRSGTSQVPGRNAVLFGDCLFDNSATPPASGGWKPLPGTAEEVAQIKNILKQKNFPASSYTQNAATEEEFKSLSGHSPAVLHLATHGFFLQAPWKRKKEGFAADERNAFTIADNPLQRSGIILAGANLAWNGQAPAANKEDGILTAYETAQLDLSGTELVVLSACNTAMGDIRGTEGVFGLQRAFKLAGVKKMILSLWKVPDAETAALMKIFYGHFLKGENIRQAFISAQNEMRKKYPPYYWAAFVLIE